MFHFTFRIVFKAHTGHEPVTNGYRCFIKGSLGEKLPSYEVLKMQ